MKKRQSEIFPLLLKEVPAGGSFDSRLDALVHKRARIFDHLAPFLRVAAINPGMIDQGHAQLAEFLRLEVKRVFARELDGVPRETLEAIDAISSFEMWHRLRRAQNLGRSRAEAVVVGAMRRLVG